MKRSICILLLLSLTLSLCSCGEAKQKETPQGESLLADIPLTEESAAPEEITIVDGTEDHTSMGWNEELTSTNGEVKIIIRDDAFDGIPETMPVIAVQPKLVTSDMVRQAAAAIFGDAPLYEYGWELSREEIGKRIAAWEDGVTPEAIREACGEDLSEEQYEQVRRTRQAILDYYREAWAHAPEEITPKECDYQFRPSEYWQEQSHDYSIEYPTYTDSAPFGVDVELSARGQRNGIDYIFKSHNVERAGFWDHSISMWVDEIAGTPQMDTYEATGHLSGTPATDEELRQAEQDAAELLREMGLGEWLFEAKAQEMYNVDGTLANRYYIVMDGWRIREIPIRPVVVTTLAGPANGGWNECCSITCANDGTLFYLNLRGLMDEGVSKETTLISLDQALSVARETMSAWTMNDRIRYIFDTDVPTGLTRDITRVSVGYYRMPTGDFSYELAPVLCFHGEESVDGVPDYSEYFRDKEADFLLIDLRDGSVINTRTDRS